MNTTPFFSIIIPTYNRAQLLSEAIKSVQAQSYKMWELLIIDDGSTDNTKEAVSNFMDDRIRYYYQPNSERSAARNNGIKNALGKYVCFLDSDDYFLTNRLELLHEAIMSNGEPSAFFYTGILYSRSGKIEKKEESIYESGTIYDFIARAFIGTPQACIARSILLEHQFNPIFNIGEDLELWLRIVDHYPLIFLSGQETVVALEHDDRSVNIERYNSFEAQLHMLRHIFSPGHPGRKIGAKNKSHLLSGAYHGIAKFHIYRLNRMAAIYYMSRALVSNPISAWSKLRLNILLKLILLVPLSKVRRLIDY